MSPRPSRDRHGRAPEQLISAVIPDTAHPRPPHPAPLPVLPAPPQPRPTGAMSAPMIGTARVDRSGRFQHGRILGDMQWFPGDHLLIDLAGVPADGAAALLITAVHTQNQCVPHERHSRQHPNRQTSRRRIDARGAITLPAAARSLCGIAVESTVVLVAEPAANRLLVRSAAVAARLLVEHLNASPPVALGKRNGIEQGHRHER